MVAHDYEFSASSGNKWRWLERNRLATLVRLYPGALLVLLAPALLATEVALLLASAAGGWGGQKLRADAEALVWLPRLLRERRAIQRGRRVSAGASSPPPSRPDLDSPFIPAVARSAPAKALLRAYWRVVRALLGR